MKNIKNIPVLLLVATVVISILLFSFLKPQQTTQETQGTFKIEKITDTIVSTNEIKVRFEIYDTIREDEIYLIVSGTYGSIILMPEITTKDSIFRIPPVFTKRAGVISYHLVQKGKTIQEGTFKLLPDIQHIGAIETYLGPRSIVANKRDYTMLVSIPTDKLDNMLPDSTQVNLNTQFKNIITTTNHNLSSGFAWKRIAAPLKTGRLSTGSTLQNHSSKELVADVFPDVALDFSITATSNHNYADGNEIITFETTQIKDAHDNIVTDGTLITFFMKDETGAFWQTNASTVNGYALAKALHPQSPSTWKINAAIKGIAQSQEIDQTFTSIIDVIPVTVIQNRNIVVGPLTSYLGQLVQEGIDVSLEINSNSYNLFTKNGEVTFHLKQEDYPKGDYTIIIQTLGHKTTQKITID